MIKHQNNVFIDPETCGSSVGYYITITEYNTIIDNKTTYTLGASVVLSDCNHKIDWNFVEDDVEKIDAAIKMLQEFRKKYIDAEKTTKKLNKS